MEYGKLIELARTTHGKIVTGYLDEIEEEMNAYFCTPVNADFASSLVAINALGVNLTNREFSILQSAKNGYLGQRLLNELAISRTKTEQRGVLEDGEMKSIEKETPIPYTAVNLPDIEQAYGALQGLKNTVGMMLEGYCGMNNELVDIIFPLDRSQEIINQKVKEAYGVSIQSKPTRDVVTLSKIETSKKIGENHHSFAALSKVFDEINATIPKPPKKTELTESEKNLIDLIIEPQYPSLAMDKAVNVARADSRLAEILSLDERYGTKVVQALGEVSDDE